MLRDAQDELDVVRHVAGVIRKPLIARPEAWGRKPGAFCPVSRLRLVSRITQRETRKTMTGSQFPCVDRLPARLLLPALIVALCIIETSPALAQVRVATPEELRRELSPGEFISLVQTTGDSVRGRLVRFTDTALDIRTETRQVTGKQRLDVTVPLATIRSLERPRDSSRNGMLIGAGVGAGVSLGMFMYAVAVDDNEIDEWGPIYLAMGAVYSGVGALVGWAIDSAHSKPHLRFNAPSAETMSIRVAPLLARRKGVALVLSF
jgi:hypothetical protein